MQESESVSPPRGPSALSNPVTVSVRPLEAGDVAFVLATWLRNFKESSDLGRELRRSVFFSGHHRAAEHVLRQASTRVWVGTLEDDSATILGYLVTERISGQDVVHFAYVKLAWRRIGVFKNLVKAAGLDLPKCVFTHKTDDASWLSAKHPGLTYDPYFFFWREPRGD